ncbi:MAG: hypothetical protein PVF83_03195 [Anaerolineales bacterium]
MTLSSNLFNVWGIPEAFSISGRSMLRPYGDVQGRSLIIGEEVGIRGIPPHLPTSLASSPPRGAGRIWMDEEF